MFRRLVVIALLTTPAGSAAAQGQLTVERIVASREFAPDFLPPTRWLDDSTYTIVQRRQDGKGADLVAVNAPRGRTSVLVSAEMLLPSGAAAPLEIEGYEWSADHSWKDKVFSSEQPFLDPEATRKWLERKDAYRALKSTGKI